MLNSHIKTDKLINTILLLMLNVLQIKSKLISLRILKNNFTKNF